MSGLRSVRIPACVAVVSLVVLSAAPPPAKHPVRVPAATAARWLKTMSVRDEAAQLVFIPFSGRPLNPRSREYRKFVRLILTEHVGGLILVNVAQGRLVPRAAPLEVASFLNKMQKLAKTPLLVAADFERGASMRVDATTVFPHAMAFTAGRDPAAARFEGEVTAREARALGVQWVLYPDTDVNNNPDNPIINIRSYGENPADVAAYARAFIEGAQSDKKNLVLTTAKHFPGHGDTGTDTHMNLATIQATRERLAQIEFVPFRAAIEGGVDSVMTAHIAVPALDQPDLPATLSRVMLTDILRGEMGFHGIIVTDSLEMGGIANGFNVADASVRALEAGNDVLLMPSDPVAAINAVAAAVQSGRIPKKRLDESVSRVLAAKVRLGLDKKRLVDLDAVTDIIDAPESNARAQTIAEHAVTLVKNEQEMVPLRAPAKTCFAILLESRSGSQGQAFQQEVRRRAPGAPMMLLDTSMSDADLAQETQPAGQCDAIVVAAFASVAAYRGDVALGGGYPALLTSLIGLKKPLALIALGNPYLLRSFPGVSAYLATYSTVPPSELAAARALFGEIPIQGRLPVTIPSLAKYGDGIQLPAAVKNNTASH